MVEENLKRICKHQGAIITSEDDIGKDVDADSDASPPSEHQDESHHTLGLLF